MVAPTASVTIVSEFDEIDGAVMLAGPLSFDDPVLVRIDLDKCAGADQGIQRVILSPDVPVENIACSGVLRKKKRHFTQALEDPVNEVRPFQQDLVWQFQGRRRDRLHSRNSAEVSVWQRYQASLMVQVTDIQSASVAIVPEFDEIDGAVMFAWPLALDRLCFGADRSGQMRRAGSEDQVCSPRFPTYP